MAVFRNTKSVAQGNDLLAPPMLVDSRIAVCERCPNFIFDSRQCDLCDCFVDVKTMLRAESCPLDKWR